MWVLGELLELVAEGRDGRLYSVRPRGSRWLAFQETAPRGSWPEYPGAAVGRLLVVEPVAPTGQEPPADEAAAVEGWTWGAARGRTWEVRQERPTLEGRRTGRAHLISYLARKGRTLAEWEHPFNVRPLVRQDGAGRIELRGRVAVDDRGILS